jgi:D-proline reductase (dithiol) PrdB
MARLSDLKWTYWLYMKGYVYRSFDWRPGARLEKPLAEARVAVVTTASFHLPDQAPFDESIRGGDYSYRVLPADCDLSALRTSHRSDAFDKAGLLADPNLALPLDRLREMAAAGEISSVAPRHFTFQGSIPAPGRLLKQSAPEVARLLRDDGVDAVLLTPL